MVFDEQGGLESHAQDLVLDEHDPNPLLTGVQIHEKFAESFIQFTRSPQTPSMYNSGFFEIPRSEFMHVAQRILETRNWLCEYSKTVTAAKKENSQDNLIFQMDMNLFSILDKKELRALAEG